MNFVTQFKLRWSSVTKPTITVYRLAPEKSNGAAVVVCPGGGFWDLTYDLEGEEVAEWLNTLGVTGVVVKYRVPRRSGQHEKRPNPDALKDVQRAISLVRRNAEKWKIDPNRIGIIGFSVGGQLVAASCTNYDNRSYKKVNDVDDVSCRPDFGTMCYAGYTKANDKDELDPTVSANRGAPPLFILHASDDSVATVEHSIIMGLAMQRIGVPVEMHIYETGEHGLGVRRTENPATSWMDSCADWMKFNGFLTPKAVTK